MTASTQLFQHTTDNLEQIKKNLTDACLMFARYFDEHTRLHLQQYIASMTRWIPRDDVVALGSIREHMHNNPGWRSQRQPVINGEGTQRLYSLISDAYDYWQQGLAYEQDKHNREQQRLREEEDRRRQEDELSALETLLDSL